MVTPGPAKKLTIYINEDSQYHHGSLYQAVMELLRHHGIAGATASRAIAGYGRSHTMHSQSSELLAEHLPIRIECIDTDEKISAMLPALSGMMADGFIEVQDTVVIATGQSETAAAHHLVHEPGRMMRIFFGEADQAAGKPLYEAIVDRLREIEIAGATVYRGILGYGAKGHTHRRSFFHLSRDLPIVITVVDTPEKIEQAAAEVAAMLGDGLITLSNVDMTRIVRGTNAEEPR